MRRVLADSAARRWRTATAALLLVLPPVAGACNPLDQLLPSRPAPSEHSSAASTATTAATALAVPSQAAPPAPAVAQLGALPSLSPLVKRVKPSVVLVRALPPRGHGKLGLGTGFVYQSDGHLLTNNHVIEGAGEIEVKLADGRLLLAKVVGRDKPTDVAVIKVDATGLAALPLGDSKALEVGDWVVAIGNPFGLEHTVSAGILSGKGRTRSDVRGLDPTGYFDFLQTDASINPGNSGGPLLNLAGQVVGINAAIRANANGIGFAIPMEMVLELLPKLVKDGRVRRSAIGIYVDVVSRRDAARLKLKSPGSRVRSLVPGGAGAKAGLRSGDIITSFAGEPIDGPDELRWLASMAGVGTTVALKVLRDDHEMKVEVTLDALD